MTPCLSRRTIYRSHGARGQQDTHQRQPDQGTQRDGAPPRARAICHHRQGQPPCRGQSRRGQPEKPPTRRPPRRPDRARCNPGCVLGSRGSNSRSLLPPAWPGPAPRRTCGPANAPPHRTWARLWVVGCRGPGPGWPISAPAARPKRAAAPAGRRPAVLAWGSMCGPAANPDTPPPGLPAPAPPRAATRGG